MNKTPKSPEFHFHALTEDEPGEIPSILAFHPGPNDNVIGSRARDLARGGRPVVQNFKQAIGESDAWFDGRFIQGNRTERLWLYRPELPAKASKISTREA